MLLHIVSLRIKYAYIYRYIRVLQKEWICLHLMQDGFMQGMREKLHQMLLLLFYFSVSDRWPGKLLSFFLFLLPLKDNGNLFTIEEQ